MIKHKRTDNLQNVNKDGYIVKYVLKLVINLMFTCPVLILLYAWLTLTFQCEYSDINSLLSIGQTALWIVLLYSSDQFYLDIWLYNICNFIKLSMRNKLNSDLHIGRRQQIIRYVYIYLFHSLKLNCKLLYLFCEYLQ